MHPAIASTRYQPGVNLLQQAWKAGGISKIIWQKHEGRFVPTEVKLNPDKLSGELKKQGMKLLHQYQKYASGETRVMRKSLAEGPKKLDYKGKSNRKECT